LRPEVRLFSQLNSQDNLNSSIARYLTDELVELNLITLKLDLLLKKLNFIALSGVQLIIIIS